MASWAGTTEQRAHGNHAYLPMRPATVLVTELGTGSFIVQGYPTGTSVYVDAEQGEGLREALDTAFGDAGLSMDVPPILKPRI